MFFAVTLLTAGLGHAQSKSADPARIQERIDRPQPKQPDIGAPKKDALQSTPDGDVQGTDKVEAFALAGVTFTNHTVFTAADFAPYYEPYLATTIGLDEVKLIAESVTDHYRTRGYFLARAIVEPQSLAFGVLTIRLVEGQLQEVRFPMPDQKLRRY